MSSSATEPAIDTPSATSEKPEPELTSTTTSSLNAVGVGLRSASAKFASLRAAFERDGAGEDTTPERPRRRVTGSSQGSDIGRDKEREYEDEIARLKDALEKEKESRIACGERVTNLEEENVSLGERVVGLEGELERLAEAAQQWETALREEMERREAMDVDEVPEGPKLVQGEASRSLQDPAILQRQLNDLKRSISKSSHATSQTSDMTLKEEFGVLQHQVQNWIVNNFRRAKVQATPNELCHHLQTVADSDLLERLQPLYQAFEAVVKLPIYQATVAYYLMDIFSDTFLFGLPKQQQWVTLTKQAAEALSFVLTPPEYSRWRAMTFSTFRNSEQMVHLVDNAAEDMAETICLVLETVSGVGESETRLPSLKAILKRAISLAHTVRVQLARYDYVLPAPGGQFDETCMDDISVEGEASGDHTLRCSVFPVLYKLSDDDGNDMIPEKVIFKAKVLCIEDDEG